MVLLGYGVKLHLVSDLPDLRMTALLLVRKAHDDDGAHAVVHAVVADCAQPAPLGRPLGRTEPSAAHDHGTESQALYLQAQPLLHVVVLHDVDFVGELGLHQGLGQGRGLGGREIVEIVLQLSLGGLHGERCRVEILGIGEWDGLGAPVGAVEDARGAHVEEHHVVPGPQVVLHGPSHGVRALVA